MKLTIEFSPLSISIPELQLDSLPAHDVTVVNDGALIKLDDGRSVEIFKGHVTINHPPKKQESKESKEGK